MTLGDIQKFGGEIVHLGRQHPDARDEIVVEHQRRDRGDEADRGRDQRLGDTRRDRRIPTYATPTARGTPS